MTALGSPESLARSTVRALGWSFGGRFAHVAAQLVAGVVLARILGPAPFGVVAVAWLVIGLGNQWSDLGLGAALVQRPALTPDDVRCAFTLQLLAGLGLTLLVGFSAELYAHLFRQPELVWIVRALALVFVIQVFGSVSASILRRGLDFKAIQIVHVLSYVLGYVCVGIPLAFSGFGAWSLVAAQLTQATSTAALLYARVQHSIRLQFRPWPAGLLGFGSKVLGANLVNWFIGVADTGFVARFYAPAQVGLYNRVVTITATPTTHFMSALSGVLFPAYSRAVENRPSRQRAYYASFALVCLTMLPSFCGLAAARHSVIEGLYGRQWAGAEPLVVPLALAVPFVALMGLAGPMLWSAGSVGRELRAQAVTAALLVTALTAAARISMPAVAWSVLLVQAARFVLLTRQALRMVDGSWRTLLRAARGGITAAVCAATAILLVERALSSCGISPALRLVPDVAAGAAAVALVMFSLPRIAFAPELAGLLRGAADRLPAGLRLLLERLVPA